MKIAIPTSASLLLVSALLGACDEPDDSSRDDEEEDAGGRGDDDGGIDWTDFERDAGGTREDASTSADASRDAGPAPSGDAGMTAIATGGDCPEPTGTGTRHTQNVTGSETWTAADSPHLITSSISVTGTLTLEACAKVLLSKGTSLAIGASGAAAGKLITQGVYEEETATKPEVLRPVIFDSANEGEYWGSLLVWYNGEAEFNTTVLVHGGAVSGGYQGALAARGPNDGSLKRMIHANTLLVLESGGYGINLQTGAGFYETAKSAATVLGAGREPAAAAASMKAIYPVYVQPPGVGTLPPGEYYGSTEQELAPNDRIYVYSSYAITGDEQFHERSVPYLMHGSFYMRPTTSATLTIDPGVELQFHVDRASSGRSAMQIGDGASIDRRPVKIDIQGTAEKPIVFTSAATDPMPGDWTGLYLDCSPASGNKLTYAQVLYAGGESGTNSYGCGPKDNDAAILITDWRPDDAFIQNVQIAYSAGGGIMSGWASDLDGPNLKAGNTFTQIANGCDVSRWRTQQTNYCEGRTEEQPLCL